MTGSNHRRTDFQSVARSPRGHGETDQRSVLRSRGWEAATCIPNSAPELHKSETGECFPGGNSGGEACANFTLAMESKTGEIDPICRIGFIPA